MCASLCYEIFFYLFYIILGVRFEMLLLLVIYSVFTFFITSNYFFKFITSIYITPDSSSNDLFSVSVFF